MSANTVYIQDYNLDRYRKIKSEPLKLDSKLIHGQSIMVSTATKSTARESIFDIGFPV